MKGGTYCGICGRRVENFCSLHPGKLKVKFGPVQKRFSSVSEAERFLTGVRFQSDTGTFDPRDWQRGEPLGFGTLSEQWLESKRGEVQPSTLRFYQYILGRAQESWGNRNIKTIGYAELDDFLKAYPGADQTRSLARACLHAFWMWVRKRRIIDPSEIPEFPTIRVELGHRKIVDKATQTAIIEEIKRLTYHANPRIWIAVRWLATYISMRPGDILRIQEKHVDRISGLLFIEHPKDRRYRVVPLLEDDVSEVRALPVGMPAMPFFRHTRGQGFREGTAFGDRVLYRWWRKACRNLGVLGVDLYGGTRHSTASALRAHLSYEQVRELTDHATNQAFERYYQKDFESLRGAYSLTRQNGVSGTGLEPGKQAVQKGKLLKFKE